MGTGTELICIETGVPSMLVLGQVYVVVEILGISTHLPGDQIIKLSNGVITYLSKFQLSAKEIPNAKAE